MKDIVIFLGVPGSGKGTQAKLLAEENSWVHISTGEIFRAMLLDQNTSAEDRLALEEMKKGKLLSDEFIFRVTFKALEDALKNKKGMVLDGVLRTMRQAEGYYEFFKDKNLLSNIKTVLIDISDDEARERLTKRRVCSGCGNLIPWLPETKNLIACPKCGGELKARLDDSKEIIEQRIKDQGSAAVLPLYSFFETKGMGERADGIGTIQEVNGRVKEAIKS